MKIQISGQYGDPDADRAFWPMQRQLNACFERHLSGVYLQSIRMFAIAFRVSGRISDFHPAGPDRLMLFIKRQRMTMDMVYARQQWASIDSSALAPVVSRDIAICVDMMIERATRARELLEEERLRVDIAKALADFDQHFVA